MENLRKNLRKMGGRGGSENLKLEENIKNLRLRWPKYIGQNHSKLSEWSKMFNFLKIAKIIKSAKFIITLFKLV